jgi:hypothetical protein
VTRLSFNRFSPSSLAGALVSLGIHAALVGATLHRPPRAHDWAAEGPVLPALYIPPPSHRAANPILPSQWGALGKREIAHELGSPPHELAVPESSHLTGEITARPGPLGELPSGLTMSNGDSIFSEVWVDSVVSRDERSAAPIYPAELLRNNLEGVVFAEFVVDTVGMVDMGSVRILTTSHALFTASVETALSQMRFRPAMRAGRRVHQLVEQHFVFQIAPPTPEQSVGYTSPNPLKP